MKVARLWGIVPHIQSSSFSRIGQNATTPNVSKGLAHVEDSRPAVRFDSIPRPLMSANVGRVPPDSSPPVGLPLGAQRGPLLHESSL